jgi:hypothetical protein
MTSVQTNFPNGLGTWPSNHAIATYPIAPTQWQITKGDDFIPFRQSTDYTATTGGTGATAAAFPWNAGFLKITSGSTTPFKSTEALGAGCFQAMPGNGLWHDLRMCAPTNSQTNPVNDATTYAGFFDTVDPSAAANGIYFIKPTGGTAVHFVVLKGGVATTFQNVGDLSTPSGLFNDSGSVLGVLTANTVGTTLTSLAVTTPGFGYRAAPLLIVNGTAGSNAAAYVQLGGSAGFPTFGAQSSASSLYATYITNAGSGYTAGTFTVDVLPLINFQFYYNGKGRLIVGINGRIVMALDTMGVNVAVPGQTYNVATSSGKSWNFSTTTLATTNVAPPVGDPIVALPQMPLQLGFGLVGTTANNRVMYVDEINVATELN